MKKKNICLLLVAAMLMAMALAGCTVELKTGGNVPKATDKVESTDTLNGKAKSGDEDIKTNKKDIQGADAKGNKAEGEAEGGTVEGTEGETEILPEKPEIPDETKRKPGSNVWRTDTTETSPAAMGEFVEMAGFTSDGEPVGVRLDEVIHGSEANDMVKSYMDSGSSIYAWEEPDEGTEFVVFKLTIDTSELDIPDYGKTVAFSEAKLATVGKNVLYSTGNTSLITSSIQIDTEKPMVKPGDDELVSVTVATLQFAEGNSNPVIVVDGFEGDPQYIEYQ